MIMRIVASPSAYTGFAVPPSHATNRALPQMRHQGDRNSAHRLPEHRGHGSHRAAFPALHAEDEADFHAIDILV